MRKKKLPDLSREESWVPRIARYPGLFYQATQVKPDSKQSGHPSASGFTRVGGLT
ncbi:MAG: hypothetical protein P9L92_13965 [Candidatus Electryonea clarkiae]|nr:hypothetical protein [Candidatus Electryonea clarkiae]MDP8285453.1 hypothetical protein [Candidatus Electryonea clarkiae]